MSARVPGFAGDEDCQNNERGVLLARMCLASRETWYASGAVRLGYAAGLATRQTPRSGASRTELVMRAPQGYQDPEIPKHRKMLLPLTATHAAFEPWG